MLKLQDESNFAFVKVAQNCLLSGVSLSGLGMLSVLELSKTNPKHPLDAKTLTKLCRAYAHGEKAARELEKAGYVTKHCYPTGKKNEFSWKIEADSFHVSDSAFGIIYYDSSANPTKGGNKRVVASLPETTYFFRVPKDLVLNPNISLDAKGLFILMLSCIGKNLSKEEIKKKSHLSAFAFDAAWKSLRTAGYLSMQKGKERNYDFTLSFLPLQNLPDGKSAEKRKELFKIEKNISKKQTVESLSDLTNALTKDEEYTGNVAEILFTRKDSDLIIRFNEELTKYLGKSIYESLDFSLLLENYRTACDTLLGKEKTILLPGAYIYTILKKSFAPIKAKRNVSYTSYSAETLKKTLLSFGKRKPKKESTPDFQTFQHQKYDFAAMYAWIAAN